MHTYVCMYIYIYVFVARNVGVPLFCRTLFGWRFVCLGPLSTRYRPCFVVVERLGFSEGLRFRALSLLMTCFWVRVSGLGPRNHGCSKAFKLGLCLCARFRVFVLPSSYVPVRPRARGRDPCPLNWGAPGGSGPLGCQGALKGPFKGFQGLLEFCWAQDSRQAPQKLRHSLMHLSFCSEHRGRRLPGLPKVRGM